MGSTQVIVLDTHTLLWWLNEEGSKLSTKALSAIEKEVIADGVVASSISAWEIALSVSKGKLELSVDVLTWLDAARRVSGFRFVPLDDVTAAKSVMMPGDFHPDPADRIIVALARELAAPLVTADRKIQAYGHVQTIW